MHPSHALAVHLPRPVEPRAPVVDWPPGRRDPDVAAVVVPYFAGTCAVVIVRGMAPPELLTARTLDVGRVVERGEVVTRRAGNETDKRREFGPEDMRALLTAVLALLSEHEAGAVIIEGPQGNGQAASWSASISGAIARALRDVCKASAGVIVEPASWRASIPRASIEARVRAALRGWPVGSAVDTLATRAAGALALHVIARINAAAPAPATPADGPAKNLESMPDAPAHAEAPAPEQLVPVVAPVAPGEGRRTSTARLAFTSDPAAAPPGRRTIAIDSGERWIGIVIAAGDAAPFALLHAETIDSGVREVPRDKPVRSKADPSKIITTKRALPWSEVMARAAEITALAVRFGCTHAAVERVENARGGNAATALVRNGEIGAACSALLASAGIDVERPTAATWHKRIVGRLNVKGEARQNAIGLAVRRCFASWPDTADDVHERDAGGIAAWSVLPPAPPSSAPATASTGTARRTRSTPAAAGPEVHTKRTGERLTHHREYNRARGAQIKADARAAAIAAGCIGCERKHRRECPLFVSKAQKLARLNAAAEAAST